MVESDDAEQYQANHWAVGVGGHGKGKVDKIWVLVS